MKVERIRACIGAQNTCLPVPPDFAAQQQPAKQLSAWKGTAARGVASFWAQTWMACQRKCIPMLWIYQSKFMENSNILSGWKLVLPHIFLCYMFEGYTFSGDQIGIFIKFVQVGIWWKRTGGSVLMCYMWNVFSNNHHENSVPHRGQNPSQPPSTFLKNLKNIIGSQYHLTLHDQFSIYSPKLRQLFSQVRFSGWTSFPSLP